jgi:hypothetical protein
MALGLALRASGSWRGLFDFLPDVVIWLLLSAILRLARGVAQVTIVARSAP